MSSISMPLSQSNLEQAHIILDVLKKEDIKTPENASSMEIRHLSPLRQIVDAHVKAKFCFAPGFTSQIALTLLKMGACSELTHRFVLEYLSHFQSNDVSLVFTANGSNLHDNHVFCLIGCLVADEALMVGRGSTPSMSADRQDWERIEDFLGQQHPESVLADPLLYCAYTTSSECKKFFEYVHQHQITHVIGIRHFPDGIVEHIEAIRSNAMLIAQSIQSRDTSTDLLTKCKQFKVILSDEAIVAGNIKPSVEQVFRRAAVSGTVNDINYFVLAGVNQDAQDDKVGRHTALHQALLHKKYANAIWLIRLGARTDIKNAEGVTARDLIEQLPQGQQRDQLLALLR